MNQLPIIRAEQRLAESRGIKGCIFGAYGAGKTSLLWTLPAASTLFIDLEAGDLAVRAWPGDSLRPRTWPECRDLAVFIGGANPSVRTGQTYSQAHYQNICERFGESQALDKYNTIFIDSITVAGRLCLQWCKSQPQALSEKTGNLDTRAVYGLHGQEMITWLTHLQHTRTKNIWFVGILEERLDEFNRPTFALQIDGNKTANELPGIVDQVITLATVKGSDGESTRALINHTNNSYGYPAKDRSGKLAMLEPPHLGQLMDKIMTKSRPTNQLGE